MNYVRSACREAIPRLWLQRIDAYNENLKNVLDWVERVNTTLFRIFDKTYDG